MLLNKLSTMILSGEIDKNKPVVASSQQGELVFK